MTLPNFLIIGAAKAGTTSLYRYLGQHPDVFMSAVKEPLYFAPDTPFTRVETREGYERLFDGARDERAVGEASTYYLNSNDAPQRVRDALPAVRLIASLRNPADRAWSGYMQMVRTGYETRPVDVALQPGEYDFELGRYAPQLQRWLALFPRRDVRIVLFDDLVRRPREVARELFEFLGVDPGFEPDLSARENRAAMPRFPKLNRIIARTQLAVRPLLPKSLLWKNYGERFRGLLYRSPDVFPETLRRRLLDQYRDDIAATSALIGRDLGHWLC